VRACAFFLTPLKELPIFFKKKKISAKSRRSCWKNRRYLRKAECPAISRKSNFGVEHVVRPNTLKEFQQVFKLQEEWLLMENWEHKFDMKPTSMVSNDEACHNLCRDQLNKSLVKTQTTQVLHC
jgi:hypothetical protein